MNHWSTASVGSCWFVFFLWILPSLWIEFRWMKSSDSDCRHEARLLIVSTWGCCSSVYSDFMWTLTQLDSVWLTNPCKSLRNFGNIQTKSFTLTPKIQQTKPKQQKSEKTWSWFSHLSWNQGKFLLDADFLGVFALYKSMGILCLGLWKPATAVCVLINYAKYTAFAFEFNTERVQ